MSTVLVLVWWSPVSRSSYCLLILVLWEGCVPLLDVYVFVCSGIACGVFVYGMLHY